MAEGAPVEQLGTGIQVPDFITKHLPTKEVDEGAQDSDHTPQRQSEPVWQKVQSQVTHSVSDVASDHSPLHPPVSFATLNGLDWAIVLCLVLSLGVSIVRGAMREVISIGSWVAGLWLAFHCSDQASHYFARWVTHHSAQVALTVALLIVFSLICGKILQWLASRCIEWGGLSTLDRFAGFWFGLLRGVVCVSLLLLLAKTMDMHHSLIWHRSALVPYFSPILDWFATWLPNQMHHMMVWLGVSTETMTT